MQSSSEQRVTIQSDIRLILVTTESNGRNLNCRYHTKLLLSINNVVYSILPTYFTLKKNIRTLYFEAISENEIVHTLNTLCFSQSK